MNSSSQREKLYTRELPKVEYPNNINVYYLRMDGKGCFDVGNIYIDRTYGTVIGTYGDANTLRINPVSTGTGTITVMDDNAADYGRNDKRRLL